MADDRERFEELLLEAACAAGFRDTSIVCPACGMRSHHPEDVRREYCANCHAFHDDLYAGLALPGPIRPASELDAIDYRLRGKRAAGVLNLFGKSRDVVAWLRRRRLF